MRLGETLAERLQRVLGTGIEARVYAARFSKAQELFRLGYGLFLEQSWAGCASALVEALLLEDKALPQELALVQVSGGPESCPFGHIVTTLREQPMPREASGCWALSVAMLAAQWLEMQMELARELVSRSQDNVQVAEVHQTRWFDLLLSLDETARKAVAAHGGDPRSDRRVLSRLTLVQSQYGANPPISRSPEDCARLTRGAVELWPEGIAARAWSGRREDLEALLGPGGPGAPPGILEQDAPQRRALQQRLEALPPRS